MRAKGIENSLKPKENPMKAVKTIKQQIFESLNRKNINDIDNNIQLKQSGLSGNSNKLNRVPSYSQIESTPNLNN